MKNIGIRELRTNPGVLSRYAQSGELALLTNHSLPISISVPFDDALLREGIHTLLAIKLFEEGSMTLCRAAKFAHLSTELFLKKLAILGITVVDQSSEELSQELNYFD